MAGLVHSRWSAAGIAAILVLVASARPAHAHEAGSAMMEDEQGWLNPELDPPEPVKPGFRDRKLQNAIRAGALTMGVICSVGTIFVMIPGTMLLIGYPLVELGLLIGPAVTYFMDGQHAGGVLSFFMNGALTAGGYTSMLYGGLGDCYASDIDEEGDQWEQEARECRRRQRTLFGLGITFFALKAILVPMNFLFAYLWRRHHPRSGKKLEVAVAPLRGEQGLEGVAVGVTWRF